MSISSLKTSIEGFNSVFAQLSNQPNIICWIRSIDYKRQLYLSPQFETIFGGSCDSLFQNPESWWDYLISSDVNTVKPIIKARIEEPKIQEGTSTMLFRINPPNGSVKYIRDFSILVYNQYDQPIAIGGAGEEISAELWHKLNNQKNQISPAANYPDEKNILDILNDENNLIYNSKKKGRPKKIVNEVLVNGIKVPLTKREAEVLYHLRLGKTAKETAEEIYLSRRTVESHLDNIKQKACCKNKLELISHLASGDSDLLRA